MGNSESKCVFCDREVPTRRHHVVPRCKGGKVIEPTCYSCEDFIHKTWTHNQLRDTYNTIKSVQETEEYQRFKKWLLKQPLTIVFKSDRSHKRTDRKFS